MKHFAIMFLSTLALLSAVKADLSARHYTQAAPDQPAVLSKDPAAPKLFERVEFYANKNLAQSLQQLRIVDNRICLVVPVGDSYASDRSGNAVSMERATDFMLLIADKDFSAATGTMQPTLQSPGILVLKDLAIEALTQKQYVIDRYQVALVPDAGAVMQLEWESSSEKQVLAGRECWNQIFRAEHLGIRRISIGRV